MSLSPTLLPDNEAATMLQLRVLHQLGGLSQAGCVDAILSILDQSECGFECDEDATDAQMRYLEDLTGGGWGLMHVTLTKCDASVLIDSLVDVESWGEGVA